MSEYFRAKSFINSVKFRFLMPFFVLVFGYVFSVGTNVLEDYKLYFRLAVALYFLVFILTSVTSKLPKIFLMVELVFLCYFSVLYFFGGSPIVINFIFLILALHFFYVSNIDCNEFLANSLIVYLLVLFIYISYLVFLGEGMTSFVIGDRERYYFGFLNPNKTGFFLFSILTLLVFNYVNFNTSFKVLMVSVLPLLYLLILTGSRTALFCILLFFILAFSQVILLIRKPVVFFPILFLILSFVVAFHYDNVLVDNLLSGRANDYHEFLVTLSVHDYFWASTEGARLDNSYLQAYFNLGLFAYLIFVILFKRAIYRLNNIEVSYVVVMLVYGLFEGTLIRPEFLLTLFFYYLLFVIRGRQYKREHLELKVTNA